MKRNAIVVGLGYWGPNLARNLAASDDFALTALVDLDRARAEKVARFYPGVAVYTSLADALAKRDVDLVCLATPVSSHAALAEQALRGGANVLVEKPMTQTVAQSRQLLAVAQEANKSIFVDHTFLYTGAVREMKAQLDSGALGKLLYVDSVRINLGLFQPDVDVTWDLAPHDLSILQYLIGRAPRTVRSLSSCHNPSGFADVAYLHLDYGDNLVAHLHLSWLSPVKVRRVILAGEKQSVIYDDLEPAEKIKIYDHGVSFTAPTDDEARRRMLVSYRKGDMRAPNVSLAEALGVELKEIARDLSGGARAAGRGEDGFAVVRVLEAATRSLKEGGVAVDVEAA
jgi:predicted dehydrogenase